MLNPLNAYYERREEPVKSCMQFVRELILQADPEIQEAWKYGMPFFCYRGKMMCYLWEHKKYLQPYIGIVDGKLIDDPDLITEKRARMKILLIDPDKDIPVERITALLKEILRLRSGKPQK